MRVIEHRKEMEARGYRLVQIWVPDDSNPTYLDELEREMESIKRADEIDRAMEWLADFTDSTLATEPDFDWTELGIDPYVGFKSAKPQQ
jgi:hypothetical protein